MSDPDEVREAIESACSGDDRGGPGLRSVKPARHISFVRLKGLLLNVVRELPEEMSVAELREQLEGL